MNEDKPSMARVWLLWGIVVAIPVLMFVGVTKGAWRR